MEVNLTEVIRRFSTPMKVCGVETHDKYFLEGVIEGVPLELSVLPGLHRESFEKASSQLRDYFKSNIDHSELYPSVRFAIESWQFKKSLASQEPKWNQPVELNALLLSPSLKDLERARVMGRSCFKLKIARGESANDIIELLKHLSPSEKIRFDGNRLLTENALENLLEAITPYWSHIDYIEEPFAHFRDHLNWRHPVALAVDESLPLLLKHTGPCGLSRAVLKPALFGFDESVRIIDNLCKRGVVVTLSSSFEGPIGMAANFALASYQNSIQPNPAGLDTLSFFN
tara:strand:+ start:4665 stop:5522 length:858 start_codon:yes stop_codon:yes gene_type:complete